MRHRDPLPFREPLRRWLERALGGDCRLRAGLPRRADDADAREGLWLQLQEGLAPANAFWLWISPELALAVVDRTLGGDALPVPATSAAARLDEAERGVLAYAVARALGDLDSGLRLGALEEAPSAPLTGSLCLPLGIRLQGSEGFAHGFLTAERAERWLPPARAVWVLAAEASDPSALCAGDVMLLEQPPGGGWLRVEGLSGHIPVRLEAGCFRPRRGPGPASESLCLEVEAGRVDWGQLADLQDEIPLAAGPELDPDEAWLRDEAGHEVRGELVRVGGRLGLRVRPPP